MKIVICWSHISGYMAACWRELAARPGVEVFLLGFESDAIAPFDARLLADVRHRLLNEAERQDVALTKKLVADEKPDIILMSGWFHPAYRKLAADPAFAKVKKIIAVDTPFRGDWKQAIGKRLLQPLLKHFERIVVAGERGYIYARYLGFAESKIRRGVYAVDFAVLSKCLPMRMNQNEGWPKRFLYVGRYADEKSIDVLVEGYRQYRAAATDPWELVCCGRGPSAGLLANQPGITDLGFVSPTQQADVYARAGAFVIASRFDPWPLVAVEAASAGLPLICSNACGSAVEVLRDHFNGYNFATGDASMLAARMTQLAGAGQDLPAWGARSQAFAAAYAAHLWPLRVFDGFLNP